MTMNTRAKPRQPRRGTKQREAIRAVFRQESRPLGVAEILERGRQAVPTLNPATVYRTLKMLSDEGWLTQIPHSETGMLYERAGKEHHHHFFCRACKRVFELPGCALAGSGRQAPAGFVIEDHELFINGLCRECSGYDDTRHVERDGT